ncbi:hypothetical protein Tco_1235051 [Tanacetum coccineum]
MRMTTGESIALEIQFDLTIELLPRVKLGWRVVEKEIVSKLLEKEERLEWWFEQNIDEKSRDVEGDEYGMKYEGMGD